MDIPILFDKLEKLDAKGFSFDTRNLGQGEIFCALKGEKVDGHDFIDEAIKKGAKALLVDREGIKAPVPVFQVENVLLTLQALAKYKIELHKPKIIGITGSVGKTTTKEFIYTLLSPYFLVVKPIRSYNSQVTLPITVLNFSKEAKIYVLEMGMNAKGEMDRLVDIAKPDIALLTNISHSHIGYFNSLQEIGNEKQKIFTAKAHYKLIHIQTTPYVNIENVKTYGPIGSGADFEYVHEDSKVQIYHKDLKSPWIKVPFSYPHFVQNVVAAFLVAREMGIGWDHIQQAAHHLSSEQHRCQLIQKKGITFFDDSYNASESSFKAAYDSCPIPSPNKKSISIVGSIKEQGYYTDEAHLNVAKYALGKCDMMLCFGEETKPIVSFFNNHQKPVYYFENKQDLLEVLRQNADEGDVVLVKGANSLKLWEIIEQL